MAKNLIIADVQNTYVERLVGYINSHYMGQYEIEVYDTKSALQSRLEKRSCEVLLMSPVLYDANIYFKNVKLPVILTDDSVFETTDYPEKIKWHINKYTRISTLLQYIEDELEEVEKNRPLVYSMYSPAGGVGQSTIAVATALAYAKIGKKVLYLNLENLDSTKMFFTDKEVPASNVLERPIEDGYDQLLADVIKQDPNSQVMYVAREFDHINHVFIDKLPLVVERIIDNEIANVVILDLSRQYNPLDEALMNVVDYLMVVCNDKSHTVYKFDHWMEKVREKGIEDGKLKVVVNESKEFKAGSDIDNVGQIDKLYAASPIELSDYIAQHQLLKLHGLV